MLLSVLVLAACGGGGKDKLSADEVRDQMSEQLAEGGLDPEAADCVAEVVVDEIGAKDLQDVDFNADEPPADLQDQIIAATTKARDECELDAGEE